MQRSCLKGDVKRPKAKPPKVRLAGRVKVSQSIRLATKSMEKKRKKREDRKKVFKLYFAKESKKAGG